MRVPYQCESIPGQMKVETTSDGLIRLLPESASGVTDLARWDAQELARLLLDAVHEVNVHLALMEERYREGE